MISAAAQSGYLHKLMVQAMPWTWPLTEGELDELAAELTDAAASGDRAPERLGVVMRAWRETADILGDHESMHELAESAEAIRHGDVIRGAEAKLHNQ